MQIKELVPGDPVAVGRINEIIKLINAFANAQLQYEDGSSAGDVKATEGNVIITIKGNGGFVPNDITVCDEDNNPVTLTVLSKE